jgi:hypothetical protein
MWAVGASGSASIEIDRELAQIAPIDADGLRSALLELLPA